jgi:hypothetical protein
MFMQFEPNVDKVVTAQRKIVNQLLIEAKAKIAAAWSGVPEQIAKYDKKEPAAKKPLDAQGLLKEGGLALYRVYKALPKYGPLIKFL